MKDVLYYIEVILLYELVISPAIISSLFVYLLINWKGQKKRWGDIVRFLIISYVLNFLPTLPIWPNMPDLWESEWFHWETCIIQLFIILFSVIKRLNGCWALSKK